MGAWLYTTALIIISIIVLHDLCYLVYLIRFSKKDKDAEKTKKERDLKNAKKSAGTKKSAKKVKKVNAEEKIGEEDVNVTITDDEQGKQNTENALISQQEEEEEEGEIEEKPEKDQDFLDHLKESIDKVGDKITGIFTFNKDKENENK